jgi:O-acetyl-ADP-ribose deacetylase (regulator of RNase III)
VITGGHNLPNDHIIHVLGPVYGQDTPEDELLADCYTNALQVAEENNIESIGFPAISTGAFGYPMDDAADVAFRTIKDTIPDLDTVKKIRFILYGERAMDVHSEVFEKVLS